MNKISEAFENKKAFIPFITGGDPSLDVTKKLILAMQEAGADLIEVGIPFSDPIAEGPVIQEADERALSAGCTLDKLFDAIKEAKDEIHIPMVFMTYVNPIFTYGKEKFMQRCVECGMAGVIVPDVPFEEKGELSGVCKEYGIELVSLIAPTSHERIKMIAKEAEGFLYCVSSLGCYRSQKADYNQYRGDDREGKRSDRYPLRGRFWNCRAGAGKGDGIPFRWCDRGIGNREDRCKVW